MKKTILLSFILWTSQSLIAQISFTSYYGAMHSLGWNEVIQSNLDDSNQSIYLDGMGINLGYAFPFKYANIELMPEANFVRFYQSFNRLTSPSNHHFSNTIIGLNLVGHIYFLDINGESKVPSVQKRGSFLKKNLFLRTSFGISNYTSIYTPPVDDNTFFRFSTWNSVWVADIGLGLGLDIGLTDFLTISPMVEIKYASPNENWFEHPDTLFLGTFNGGFSSFPNTSTPQNLTTQTFITQFGIRMKVAFW